MTTVLLDTAIAEDAYACGHDKRVPVRLGGLMVTAEADRNLGTCVTLNGQDGEISLIGDAEVKEVIRALERALALNARAAALEVEEG
jgi:metal-dependent amidase/aminoacylase/carboxypeptidase family protein